MACKLVKSLNNKLCSYAVAGANRLLLANWYPPTTGASSVAGAIAYVKDEDGNITDINLPTGEEFYEVGAATNTISFTDALLEGGNGAKYRQHTVNAVLNQFDLDVIAEGDAMSLGTYIAVIVDSSGVVRLLGRTNGLSAPAGGFDYNSGAAEADAMGWTVVLQGASGEISQIVENISMVTPIYEAPEIEP